MVALSRVLRCRSPLCAVATHAGNDHDNIDVGVAISFGADIADVVGVRLIIIECAASECSLIIEAGYSIAASIIHPRNDEISTYLGQNTTAKTSY